MVHRWAYCTELSENFLNEGFFGKVRNISGVNQGFLKKDLIENIIYLNVKTAYHSLLNLLQSIVEMWQQCSRDLLQIFGESSALH